MAKINDTCIGCGSCATIAPELFKVEGVPAKLIKQPETPEEMKKYEEAKAACPTGAIE